MARGDEKFYTNIFTESFFCRYLCFICDYNLCELCAAKQELQTRRLSGEWHNVPLLLHWPSTCPTYPGLSAGGSRRASQAPAPANTSVRSVSSYLDSSKVGVKVWILTISCQLGDWARLIMVRTQGRWENCQGLICLLSEVYRAAHGNSPLHQLSLIAILLWTSSWAAHQSSCVIASRFIFTVPHPRLIDLFFQ